MGPHCSGTREPRRVLLVCSTWNNPEPCSHRSQAGHQSERERGGNPTVRPLTPDSGLPLFASNRSGSRRCVRETQGLTHQGRQQLMFCCSTWVVVRCAECMELKTSPHDLPPTYGSTGRSPAERGIQALLLFTRQRCAGEPGTESKSEPATSRTAHLLIHSSRALTCTARFPYP